MGPDPLSLDDSLYLAGQAAHLAQRYNPTLDDLAATDHPLAQTDTLPPLCWARDAHNAPCGQHATTFDPVRGCTVCDAHRTI